MKTHLMTTAQVADHYKVSRQAVHLWRKDNCPFVQLGPQTILYDLRTVHQWLLQNRNERRNRGAIK